jgi:hypothetical protein
MDSVNVIIIENNTLHNYFGDRGDGSRTADFDAGAISQNSGEF